MNGESDSTFLRLRHLAVAEPDRARSERVRMHCRAALAKRHARETASEESRRFTTLVLESGFTYGLCLGYLGAMIHDLTRMYLRR